MIVLRILGQIFIAAALMLLGADAISSLKSDAITLMSLNEFIGLLGFGNPQAGLGGTETGFFSQGASVILGLASWVTVGFLGVVMAWAGDIHGR